MASELLGCKVGQVTPEVHITEDELVVLLGALIASMQSRYQWFVLHLIKHLRHRSVILLHVCDALLALALPARQVAVHEHEARIFVIEPDGNRSFVCSHSLRSSLVLD